MLDSRGRVNKKKRGGEAREIKKTKGRGKNWKGIEKKNGEGGPLPQKGQKKSAQGH